MPEPQKDLTPEQREQVEQALSRGRAALKGVTRAGILGLIFRGLFGSMFRRLRFGGRKLMFLGIGMLVVVLSVATCSAGVNLQNLTAEYGAPVPATTDAAQRFVQRTAAAIQNAPTSRRLRITVSQTEATSALSLGLMMPELMRAMETLPAEQVQQAGDIKSLRAMLRDHETAQRENRTFRDKVAGVFDPRLRTGDVQVQFTGNGEIVMAGYVQAWRWKQPALVVFAPRARSGELELDFVKGRLGRLPAPAWAFDLLGRLAASLILQGQDYAEISNLTVQDGRLTFEARVTR
jgi:hypothetical protein